MKIATGIANGNPKHPKWRETCAEYRGVLAAIPASRLLTPDEQVWCEAGLVAGTLARTRGLQSHQREELLNDALILLSAAKVGLAVLTSDRDHYDLLQQVCPDTIVVFY